MGAAVLLTTDEIDALAVPVGWTPGPRPVDGLPPTSGLTSIYGEERAKAVHAEYNERLAVRMAEAAGRRYNWTQDQIAAAIAVFPYIPVHGTRGGRMVGTEPLPVLLAAAKRAAKRAQAQGSPS